MFNSFFRVISYFDYDLFFSILSGSFPLISPYPIFYYPPLSLPWLNIHKSLKFRRQGKTSSWRSQARERRAVFGSNSLGQRENYLRLKSRAVSWTIVVQHCRHSIWRWWNVILFCQLAFPEPRECCDEGGWGGTCSHLRLSAVGFANVGMF